jgi:hypothetical protein
MQILHTTPQEPLSVDAVKYRAIAHSARVTGVRSYRSKPDRTITSGLPFISGQYF